MKIGIIVLNWNGILNSLRCLSSIYRSDINNFHVVFVDNGSIDGSVETLKAWAKKNKVETSTLLFNTSSHTFINEIPSIDAKKHLSIISIDNNKGYGGGNNIGLKYLVNFDDDYILILNNDMKLYSNTLRFMAKTLAINKTAGAVGCDIIDMDTRKQLPNGNMNYWLGVHFLLKFPKGTKGLRTTNFIPGCAMLVRKEVFEAVGGFNEDYFLYTDDIEFCHRVQECGWKLIINLNTKVMAKVSASSGGRRSPLYYYFIVRNTLYFICNQLEDAQRTIAMIAFLSARIAQIIQWMVQRKHALIIAAFTGFIDFLKGTIGIGSAKKYLDKLELDTRMKRRK